MPIAPLQPSFVFPAGPSKEAGKSQPIILPFLAFGAKKI
jgi:hypothetical protein